MLDRYGGAGPGFDLLRLFLSLAILASHCSAVAGTRGFIPSLLDLIRHFVEHAHAATMTPLRDPDGHIPFARPIVVSYVPMFFALSGFLVTGSAFRTRRVLPFLALRFFRIFPALCVEIFLSAFLIGAIFTSLPRGEYFTSMGFYRYFGNIVGWVTMFLPGVTFAHDDVVNANLWTLPGEFHCYAILAVLIAAKVVFDRAISTILFAIAAAALLIANIAFGFNAEPFILAGDINIFYFFVGALFFIWRDRIPYTPWLLILSTVSTYAFSLFTTHAVYIVPFMLSYITVFLGLTDFGQYRIVKSGDYSYGVYLYGFPISQVALTVFPGLHGNYFGVLVVVVSATLAFAFLSWHLVEKRFLRLRKRFSVQSARIADELHPDAFHPQETDPM